MLLTTWSIPAYPTEAIPTAVVPAPGCPTVTVGAVLYPTPPSIILNLITPWYVGSIEQVAAAPVPPPPEMVIVGGVT